jgi:hypothetical protein
MGMRFTVEDLRRIMRAKYPDPAEEEGDEHPMTAVGVVLLSAAIMETTDAQTLIRFTGYGREFISAITLNMQNNRLWIDDRYDRLGWLFSDGAMDLNCFWDHIEAACGELWFPESDPTRSVDTCRTYWDEHRRSSSAPNRS